jgi:plasmid stabilization system protein ParE
MTDLILLSQADLDIQAAFGRYEEIQSGRGEVFMRQLDGLLTMLRSHPEIAPVYSFPYRRLLMLDFPYGVFYQAQSNRIIVGAIMDLRQNPDAIRRSLFGDERG